MIVAQGVDQLAETILGMCEREDVSLFVGAGTSLEPPASMPSANDLKWRILESLVGREPLDQERSLVQEYLNAHMLELFLQDLKETIGPGAVDVLDVFRVGEPNLYHRLIAQLAKQKLIRRVFTTNFDCLIERALADEGIKYIALSTEHDFAEYIVKPEEFQSFNVIKLHGTIAFMDGGRELTGLRDVKAISPLKLEMRKARREFQRRGFSTFDIGFERKMSARDTLIESLDHLGLSLSEVTTELLRKHLQNSTLIVIGWNGFDLDISPVILEHAKKVCWIIHTAESDGDDCRAEVERKLDKVRDDLRTHGFDDTRADMMLLATTPDFSLDVMPTPEKERAQLLKRSSESMETRVFTPLLIRCLWSRLTSEDSRRRAAMGPIRHPWSRLHPPTEARNVRLTIYRWKESLSPYLPLRWACGKFLLSHGEYDTTQPILQEVIDAVATEGLHDVTAMLHLDLGELNAIYGKRAEAERAYLEAIRLYREEIGPRRERSGIIEDFHLYQLVERAYFGLGELACEFSDFTAAARAFRQMPTDKTIVDALVHYCLEEFEEAKHLFDSEIRFVRLGRSRFHYYLYYFIKLLDARLHWMRQRLDSAAFEFEEVLTATTKLGFPRLQVQALNGLAITYSSNVQGAIYKGLHRIDPLGHIDPYYDCLKAAKFAAQSIAIANQAQYRYGRAHAGYYMGTIYAAVGLHEVATSALRFAEQLFDKLEHTAGLDFCKQAKARHHLTWESPASARTDRHRARGMKDRQYGKGSQQESASPATEATGDSTGAGSSVARERSRDLRVEVCWLDFWGGSPSMLNGLLLKAGFRQIEQIGGLEVWRSDEFPDLVLEVLNVDSYPQEPVSKLPGLTAQRIDDDRRRCCVPRGMDPYYRCSIYEADLTSLATDLYEQLSEARSLLNSYFVEIASFPGAHVMGDWAVWERITVISRLDGPG